MFEKSKHFIKKTINKIGYDISKYSHTQANELYQAAGDGYIEPSATGNGKPALIDDVPLNYGRSFVCGTASANSVRFYVESRTILFGGDQSHEFLQCGSCKSEHAFAKKDLFTPDNYDFLPILGDDGQWLIFRRRNRVTPGYRQTMKNVWGPTSRKRSLPTRP